MKKFYYFGIFIVFLFSINNLKAQIQWQQTGGPFGGWVQEIILSPSEYLLAVTSGRTYKSTDEGMNWNQQIINNFIPLDFYFDYAGHVYSISKFDDNSKNKIYRSDNDMNTWTLKNIGLEDRGIYSVSFLGNDIVLALTDNGVYKSTNMGDSWSLLYQISIAQTKRVEHIKVNSKGAIFIGTLVGLFRSTDNGTSWKLLNDSQSQMNTNIENIFIGPQDKLFVTTPYGIYRSYDDGDTWLHLTNGIVQSNIGFLKFIGNQEFIAGTSWSGIYHSTDDGGTWTKISDKSGADIEITSNGKIFIANSLGILYNESLTGTWSYRSNGIKELTCTAILINKFFNIHNGDIIIGDVNGGIHKSTDDGASWNFVHEMDGAEITSIKYGSNGNIFVSSVWGGVSRSTDDGDTWIAKNNGLDDPDVRALIVGQSGNLFAGTFSKVYKSTDDGESWVSCLSQSQSLQCYALANNKKNMIFAGSFIYGALRSTNGGTNWTQITNGMQLGVIHLAINDNDELFAITTNGNLYYSTNDGDNWTLLKSGMGMTNLFFIGNNDILTSVDLNHQDVGIYRSTDKGITWFSEKSGIENIFTYQCDKNSEGYIYVCTGTGVYRSGSPITKINENTSEHTLLNLFPNPANNNINLKFNTTKAGWIKLGIYDIMGNKIISLADEYLINGEHNIILNIENLSQGNYYLKGIIDGEIVSKPIIIIK
jgi:photosystem II stability/assembly factor-like uncharacterized protein